MGSVTVLWLILLALLVVVGGKDGLSAFFSLFVNFTVLFAAILMIALGLNPVAVGIVASFLLLAIVIYWNPASPEAKSAAFKASMMVLGVLLLLIIVVTIWAALGGFGLEDSDELEGLSILLGVSFRQLAMVTALLSSLGAIGEAAVAIASGLNEITEQHPKITASQLQKDGLEIGQQIIGTALNTLFFGFFGSSLGLFIWLNSLHYSFGDILNDKIFATELVAILVALLGVVLTIPFTSWIISRKWRNNKE